MQVKQYLLNFLNEQALERVFKRASTDDLAGAKTIIEGAFNKMDKEFSPKKEKEQVNEAM